ncbi:hypothetical protein LUZ61_000188 [Rhynchospora tenuis]|uniref:Uncharacterized protein n=1 Tax=Rhynchospora tenuis TaxID=198213 RepID=A0AAD5ZEP1_9POAL|nr:hypothetical protein LUZ61_000188 [Rhynchospora tenuis]
MDFGVEQDGPSCGQKRKKRYHRHTPRQIQQLEAMFKECPHPDEKQRSQLSREVGLDPRQIKFWFQNRRTQLKAHHERADNCFLRAENDKIRCENIAMREALKKVLCPNCGASHIPEDSYFDEQKLRMENARLKEELDRASSITSRYLGRPITQLPPVQPLSFSSLDLTVGDLRNLSVSPSLDLDLLTGASSDMAFPFPIAISEMEKPIMAEMAAAAMNELVKLAQSKEPLWVKQEEGREVLSLDAYDNLFLKAGTQFRGPDTRVEASKNSGMVYMDAASLVDMFLESRKWMEFFPTIVSKARTIDILAHGMPGRSGTLLLMYAELHVLSPLGPTREFHFLRYCQQMEQGLWAIADVSVDLLRENQFATPSNTRRLPSGCIIQEMASGYSKITWVEHMEIEEKALLHLLYRDLVISGAAFGAQRWLATLQRTCDRFTHFLAVADSPRDIGGVSSEGKRSMMKLSQKMVNNFCANLSASQMQRWTALSGVNNDNVLVTVQRFSEPGQPSGVVLSAATSIWLPVSCDRVFNFLINQRSQWDVLSSGNSVQEVTSIACGSHPGNCISLLRGMNATQSSMLILQETCTDASGSLVVYTPIEFNYINVVLSGEDPSNIPIQPSSGFTILPDWRAGKSDGAASTSSNTIESSYGSLVTVAFQILVSSLPSAKLNVESVSTVNNLISTTVEQIKAALNCPSG